MKAIIQRVRYGKVIVDNQEISAIGPGICVLLGISKEDTQQDLDYMVRKILNLRVFEDETGKRWMKSVTDLKREVLCISQFTLCHTLKGNKPDFRSAMATDESRAMYEQFLAQMCKNYEATLVKNGVFGAHMQVCIENDGPVTLELESPKLTKE